jgi:macrolide-specific efflux system membrane fusion protein
MKIIPPSRRFWLITAALLLIAGAGVYLFKPSAAAPRLLTATARIADLEESVLASGAIEAFEQVSVGAQVSGQLKTLKVALGDDVKKGQLVAEIDSLTQQNTLKTAEAELANVEAQKRAKQALLHQYELAFERQKTMLAQDAGSRGDYEAAEATLATTRAEIAALDAQIRQAAISVDTARVNLGYTQIVSPIAGKVVAIVTKQGQTVNANQSAPTIIKVAQLDRVTVKAEISEADVTRVKAGQRVYFTILGEPDRRYETTLRYVEPASTTIADSSTSSTSSSTSSSSSSSSSTAVYYNGVLDVPNPENKLRIAMTAEVNIVLGEARGALTVPSTALEKVDSASGRYRVRVLRDDQRVVPREVRVGMNNKVDAQVLEGLREGEQVVIGEASAGSETSSSARRGPPPMM